MHLAGKANDLFETGKRVAGLFMPAIDRLAPGAIPHMMKGIGVADRVRNDMVAGHQGMLDKIHQNSDIVAAARAARPMLQPYLS